MRVKQNIVKLILKSSLHLTAYASYFESWTMATNAKSEQMLIRIGLEQIGLVRSVSFRVDLLTRRFPGIIRKVVEFVGKKLKAKVRILLMTQLSTSLLYSLALPSWA